MILQTLVRNYFEIHGNFDGILESPIGHLVQNAINKSGQRAEAFYYGMLGYKTNNPEAFMRLRVNLQKGITNPEEFKQVTGKVANNRKDMLKLLKMHDLLVTGEDVKSLVISGVANLDKLAATFYSTDLNNIIIDNNEQMPFNQWVFKHRGKPVKEVMSLPEVQKCLLDFKTVQNCTPLITNKTMFVPVEVSAKTADRINNRALTMVMLKKQPRRLWADVKEVEFPFLGDTNPNLYLEIIDYAIANEITYSELADVHGVKIPDLIHAWELTGYAFAKVGEAILCAVEDKSAWIAYTVENFIQMVTASASEGASATKRKGVKLDELRCF